MSAASDAPGMVIVGAGECGARAAVTLRENGWKGYITLIGREPHLPYERPPLSKSFISSSGQTAHRPNADAERFSELDIAFRSSSSVRAIDRAGRLVELEDGSMLSYHRLLLATGAAARGTETQGADVLTFRTVDDARRISEKLEANKHVVILGAGLIGLELAAGAAARGCKVTVLERQARSMARNVPVSLAFALEQRHLAAGVDLQLNVEVVSIASHSGSFSIQTSAGQLLADTVIAGIGATPNIELGAASGLELDNGISTDRYLRTSDPAIYAAGDCASTVHPLFGGRRLRLESWRNALEQGERAARNMLGEQLLQNTVPWFWSDQYELCLQIAGMADMGCRVIEREPEAGAILNLHLDERHVLVAASALGPLHAIAREMRIAEMLIARSIPLDAELLKRPDQRLKSFLAA
jgi:3-phenylpropionate/trans-cinnamate dioxygenase ferredoxin reductase subunit